MLSLSLVNIFYIISGFLLNFKEISRFVLDCCAIAEPFISKSSIMYISGVTYACNLVQGAIQIMRDTREDYPRAVFLNRRVVEDFHRVVVPSPKIQNNA